MLFCENLYQRKISRYMVSVIRASVLCMQDPPLLEVLHYSALNMVTWSKYTTIHVCTIRYDMIKSLLYVEVAGPDRPKRTVADSDDPCKLNRLRFLSTNMYIPYSLEITPPPLF